MGEPKVGQNRSGKTPGSGRKKGTPNKKTAEIYAICERRKIIPFDRLLDFTQHSDPGIALTATKAACEYIHPKRKALELSEDPDNPPGKALDEKHSEEFKRVVAELRKERK